MALTNTINAVGQASGATITSGALSVATGDFIDICAVYADNGDSTAWTLSNTGTAITWTKQQETNLVGGNVKVVHWTGTAEATPPTTVSVQSTAGANSSGAKALFTIVHTGQHATTPLPAGNLFSIASGTDVSQVITPTSGGSNLWMVVGDWNQSNSFVAGTNCTLAVAAIDLAGQMTAVVTRPTTQPRTDTTSFTLSTLDTGGKVCGVAFEVQADASGGGGGGEILMGQACL
jgi:hypothetical protein